MDMEQPAQTVPSQSAHLQTPTDEHEHKGKLPIIIGGILVLLIVGIGIFYVWEKNDKQIDQNNLIQTTVIQPSANPTLDPTTNWKTYNKHGYSFRYPQDWKLESSQPDSVDIFPSVKKSHLGDNISIVIHPNPKNMSAKEYVDSKNPAGAPHQFIEVNVNGIVGQQPTDVAEATDVERVFLQHGTNIYELFIQSDSEEYEQIFNQLLQAFAFTK